MAFQRFGQHDRSFIADSLGDLEKISTDISMGSTCYVIEEASKYMMTSDGRWINQDTAKSSSTPSTGGGSSDSGSGDSSSIDLSQYVLRSELEEYVKHAELVALTLDEIAEATKDAVD